MPAGAAEAAVERAPSPPPSPPAPAVTEGKTALAIYDYEATEDNELSFPDGATIEDVQFPDDDWWHGHYKGKEGLFVGFLFLDGGGRRLTCMDTAGELR